MKATFLTVLAIVADVITAQSCNQDNCLRALSQAPNIAPGEIDVQIAAAVYTSCDESMAYPEACETHTNYHAGVPTGCLSKLVPGGTGGGGSNFSGSLSATYAVCKAS